MSHQSRFDEGAQLVHRDILNQLDLLLCCVSDYVLMKQSHPFCMINCAEDIFGKRGNGHSYSIFARSQNSYFDKLYLSSISGRVNSRVEAPFS